MVKFPGTRFFHVTAALSCSLRIYPLLLVMADGLPDLMVIGKPFIFNSPLIRSRPVRRITSGESVVPPLVLFIFSIPYSLPSCCAVPIPLPVITWLTLPLYSTVLNGSSVKCIFPAELIAAWSVPLYNPCGLDVLISELSSAIIPE